MVNTIRNIKYSIFAFLPTIVLFVIALNGSAIINIKFVSINVHYILVYYWALRKPQYFGYGFIFLAGITSDVVFGVPLGVNALCLLVVAAIATYIRVVTVRVTLLNDWLSFIPALLLANFTYFLSLYFSGYNVDYLYLFENSVFTFIFYPILWAVFTLYNRVTQT